MTIPEAAFQHASTEGLIDQTIALLKNAKIHIANRENDPQAIEQAKTQLDAAEQIQGEVRKRMANARRDGAARQAIGRR